MTGPSSGARAVVLRRARIHDLSAGAPTPATALALRHGRIVAVGADAEVWAAAGSDAPSIDLGGRVVLPGFTDAHVHWATFALLRRQLALDATLSLADVLRRVRAAAADREPGRWLVGRGWDHSRWGRWPTAADLDSVAPHVPVALTRKDGHAIWVNSAALAATGINGHTPDPAGGEIVRAGQTPTGVLKENAVRLVHHAMPSPDPVERQAAMIDAWPDAWGRGLTGMHDMGGLAGGALFRDLSTLRDAGELGLRFVWYLTETDLDEAIALGLRSGLGDAWLTVGGLKLFLDGTLGSQTADMLAPYEGDPANRGLATLEFDAYVLLLERASAAGLSTAVHAIGDAANRKALDGFARMQRGHPGPRPLRGRIEHAQLLAPEDVGRFGALGVVASMQPLHATSDRELADRLWGERAAYSYAWRSLLVAGARLAFGSDAPIEALDVFAGVHAAVTRRRAQDGPRGGWRVEQAVDVRTALQAYTAGPAWAAGLEDQLGSLEVGKRADLIVLDRDPLEIPPGELLDLAVRATMIDGVWVWQAPGIELPGPRHDGP